MKRKNRKRLITRKIKRGSLIQYSLDNIKRDYFNVIKRELKNVLKKRSGIYALYKGDKVVRVGQGTDIYWRMKGHSKSGKLKWDRASLFIINSKRIENLRDLETAVVRIAKPKYNKVKGRIGNEWYLGRMLKKSVKEKKKKLRAKEKRKDKELRKYRKGIQIIEETVR